MMKRRFKRKLPTPASFLWEGIGAAAAAPSNRSSLLRGMAKIAFGSRRLTAAERDAVRLHAPSPYRRKLGWLDKASDVAQNAEPRAMAGYPAALADRRKVSGAARDKLVGEESEAKARYVKAGGTEAEAKAWAAAVERRALYDVHRSAWKRAWLNRAVKEMREATERIRPIDRPSDGPRPKGSRPNLRLLP